MVRFWLFASWILSSSFTLEEKLTIPEAQDGNYINTY